MTIKFSQREKTVVCVLTIEDGPTFKSKPMIIKTQADRVDGVKRAKQYAFVNVLTRAVVGYVSDRIGTIDKF